MKYLEPKIVKGRKDYICLTCGKEIKKGTKHLCFSHSSEYLAEAFEALTKYRAWAKIPETLVTLRFCSRTCFKAWKVMHLNWYDQNPEVKTRYYKIVIEARNRRLQGWKNWKTWKEVFEPLDKRWKLDV